MSITKTADVYLDFHGIAQLKADAGRDDPRALEQVAEQFEALFLQMMLKSMRQAGLGEGLLDNDQSRLYQEMFDQQIAIDMAKRRQAGIAEAMLGQLRPAASSGEREGDVPLTQERLRQRVAAFTATRAEAPKAPVPAQPPFEGPDDFVQRLLPLARRHGEALGVAPEVLLAQAALETGWGRAIGRDEAGRSSHNLFNIKADERWPGRRVVVSTLEYEGGVARRQQAAFRAYDSFEESFRDYVDFVRSSPRYREALERAGDGRAYIEALHRAGYATDPDYADKVGRILEREVLTRARADFKEERQPPLT